MTGTISVTEAKKRNPNFFKDRPDDVNWTLTVIDNDGKEHVFIGADWEAKSRFGSVKNVVVVDQDGMPAFDRPQDCEAPNVNMIVWGRERNGEVKVAYLTEARPHANDPEDPDSTETLVFGQIPMGFVDRLFSDVDIAKYETMLKGAVREAGEETGASLIVNQTFPRYPHLFPSPSFTGTASRLYFLEVDLSVVKERLELGADEQILKSEFITVPELLARIRAGVEEVDGQRVIHRYGNSLALFMIFFAYHPDFFQA